ncbi:MAG: hypothetical protein ACYDHW_11025 [Syntrophorhabdaceae bacterium]
MKYIVIVFAAILIIAGYFLTATPAMAAPSCREDCKANCCKDSKCSNEKEAKCLADCELMCKYPKPQQPTTQAPPS